MILCGDGGVFRPDCSVKFPPCKGGLRGIVNVLNTANVLRNDYKPESP